MLVKFYECGPSKFLFDVEMDEIVLEMLQSLNSGAIYKHDGCLYQIIKLRKVINADEFVLEVAKYEDHYSKRPLS